MVALMQLLTIHALFMGWIWAMYWSYLICMRAWGKMPNGQPRESFMVSGANPGVGFNNQRQNIAMQNQPGPGGNMGGPDMYGGNQM